MRIFSLETLIPLICVIVYMMIDNPSIDQLFRESNQHDQNFTILGMSNILILPPQSMLY
jgi:hypothetical protein